MEIEVCQKYDNTGKTRRIARFCGTDVKDKLDSANLVTEKLLPVAEKDRENETAVKATRRRIHVLETKCKQFWEESV